MFSTDRATHLCLSAYTRVWLFLITCLLIFPSDPVHHILSKQPNAHPNWLFQLMLLHRHAFILISTFMTLQRGARRIAMK